MATEDAGTQPRREIGDVVLWACAWSHVGLVVAINLGMWFRPETVLGIPTYKVLGGWVLLAAGQVVFPLVFHRGNKGLRDFVLVVSILFAGIVALFVVLGSVMANF